MTGWKELLIDILKLTDEVKKPNRKVERVQDHVVAVYKLAAVQVLPLSVDLHIPSVDPARTTSPEMARLVRGWSFNACPVTDQWPLFCVAMKSPIVVAMKSEVAIAGSGIRLSCFEKKIGLTTKVTTEGLKVNREGIIR